MPLVTTYKLQYLISKDGSEVTTDADGQLKFTDESQVKEYDESKTTCEYKLAPADVDLALLRELGVTADNVPASVNVYYRLSAKTTSTPKVYSNIVMLHNKYAAAWAFYPAACACTAQTAYHVLFNPFAGASHPLNLMTQPPEMAANYRRYAYRRVALSLTSGIFARASAAALRRRLLDCGGRTGT